MWCRTVVGLLAIATISMQSNGVLAHEPAPVPSSVVYVVKPGDYLAGIATALGVKLPDLLALNSITATSAIYPGDTLNVPAGGVVPPVADVSLAPNRASSGLTYTVVSGDYLGKIATKLDVSLASLLAINDMTIGSLIVPGALIAVPDGGTLPTAAAESSSAVTPATLAPTYVVKPGDFLIDIAAKNGVTLKALLAVNGLIASSIIVPGRTLTLPPATMPLKPTASTPPSPGPATPLTTAPPAESTSISTVVAFLQAQIGKSYAFNKAGPDSYDCSGLVRAAYLQIGISLPHQSLLQSRMGSPIDWRTDDIRAGDLVFAFSTGKDYISHVGVAISSTQWISSSQTGVPVKVGPLPADDRIQAVRRIVPG